MFFGQKKADASTVSTGESYSNQTGSESACRIQKLPRLLVVSADGQLLIYNVDPQEGGECTLAHKHRYAPRQSQPRPERFQPMTGKLLFPVTIQL